MTLSPPRLGVNIDHVATLRQARGTAYPDVVAAAAACERAGAHGLTVHLREDRRHIQDRDVYALRAAIATRLNLEMANSPEILRVALDVVPDEVCIVPERRAELTTEGGLEVREHLARLRPSVRALADAGIAVSLFVDPDRGHLDAAAELDVPYVELHTGAFCGAGPAAGPAALSRLRAAAQYAHGLGLRVNAGHGINLETIRPVLSIPHLDTLNIGHSIVARAVFVGLETAVREMLAAMALPPETRPESGSRQASAP